MTNQTKDRIKQLHKVYKRRLFTSRYVGKVFGKLTIIAFNQDLGREKEYLCLCTCGNHRLVPLSYLKHKGTDRCELCMTIKVSCIRSIVAKNNKDIFTNVPTHGECATPFYKCWAGMKSRCNNQPNTCYVGITYDKNWEHYENFRADMYEAYFEGACLDRINSNLGYSKDNCQWLSKSEHGVKTRKDNSVFNKVTI